MPQPRTITRVLPGQIKGSRFGNRDISPVFILLFLFVLVLLPACSGGGGDDDEEEETSAQGVEISGTILEPGGTATNSNPIGLQGAANRPVSLYRVDDNGNIIGDVLDTGNSDANGNYVLLLPSNVKFSSDLIVEARLEGGEIARAIVIDKSTDITPITEYITQKLIDDPNLDLSALPVEEVEKLIVFVESLPLGPQPDMTSMLAEIAVFSDVAIEAEINDLATANPQIRISGLLSIPSPAPSPRGLTVVARSTPVPNQAVELYEIDAAQNYTGPIASATTNSRGVFTMLLPVGRVPSSDLILRADVSGDIVESFVIGKQVIVDAISKYLKDRAFGFPEFTDVSQLPIEELAQIDAAIRITPVVEADDLPTALNNIDTAAGQIVTNEFVEIVIVANETAPVITPVAPIPLTENSPNGTPVVTVIATDADPVGGVTGFRIDTGNTGNAFAIANDGAISVANTGALDFETASSFILTIIATDGSNDSAGVDVTINLTDLNDNPPVVDAAGPFAVAENAANDTTIGPLTATDLDTVGTPGFRIESGDPGGAFAIDANDRIVVANTAAIDFETATSFALEIIANDGVFDSAPRIVTVDVADVNDNTPVVDAVGPFAVDEDAADGAVVGLLTATDPDTVGTPAFRIDSGDPGNAFTIDANDRILVANTTAIDFETATSFALEIIANDGIFDSASQSVTVNVNDVNDTAPIVNAAGPFSVAENVANSTVVGTITASDVDTVGSITGFDIATGDPDGAFAIDAAGEITVADSNAIDFETATAFNLSVTATDGVNTSSGQAVVVDVTDVNDTAPVVNAAGPFVIVENSPPPTPVGTVTATDADTLGNVAGFNIVAGNTDGAFAIDNGGAITVASAVPLDRETNPSFTLTITANDDVGNTSAGEDVIVNLEDLNDTAPAVTPGQSFLVASSAINSTVVGTVATTDADLTGALASFSITAGNTNNTFAIAPDGQISVADNSNLLGGSPYSLTVEASDDGGNTSLGETVSITVTTGSGGAVWDNFTWDDGSTWQ